MEINNNKAYPRHGDADLLQRFSRALMELTELPRCSMPERWLCEAIQGFANIVSFDAAWWGQLYLPSDTSSSIFSPSVMMDGSLGLSSSFAQEWHSISGADRFAKASISYLGKAVRGGHDDLPDTDFVRSLKIEGLSYVLEGQAIRTLAGLHYATVDRLKHAPIDVAVIAP